MTDTAQQLSHLLIHECRRRLLEESIPRLKKCLMLLSEEEIWYRPNAHSNSVGNLCLHLCGNARQWLISGLGGKEDIRERQAEFDETGPIPTRELVEKVDQLAVELSAVLNSVKVATLLEEKVVQGFAETGISILIHVVEHFSYHVGQITYFVKAHKDIATGYYEGQELG